MKIIPRGPIDKQPPLEPNVSKITDATLRYSITMSN